MDIVLLKDIDRLGKGGGVVQVKPGYARNFLLPRGLAVAATPQNLRRVEEIKRLAADRNERQRLRFEDVKQRLEQTPITQSLAVGEEGTPFGSVSANDITIALKAAGFEVDRSMVRLDAPIKALGEFEVSVRLMADVVATVKLAVVKAP
jgi:large subunit ribosomal protein L9